MRQCYVSNSGDGATRQEDTRAGSGCLQQTHATGPIQWELSDSKHTVSLQQAHPRQARRPMRMAPLARAHLSLSSAQLRRPRQAQLCWPPQAHAPARTMLVRSSQQLRSAFRSPRVRLSALLTARYGCVQPVLASAQPRLTAPPTPAPAPARAAGASAGIARLRQAARTARP